MDTICRQLPNLLSISRVPSSALFLLIFSTSEVLHFWMAVTIAMVAQLTDVADGYFARKWGLVSETGYFLDGLGDKCFTISFCLVIPREHPEVALLMWALITRELLLYGLRAIDPLKAENIARFRIFSLWQAASIRVLFGVFLLLSALKVHGHDESGVALVALYMSAVSAIIFGWASILFLALALTSRAN